MAEQTTQTFSDLIESVFFTFKVGEELKPFVVHANAIAATSDVFRALVQGGLSESETRSAELRDIRPDDFVRFLEYAYRREYTVPTWGVDEPVVSTGGWGIAGKMSSTGVSQPRSGFGSSVLIGSEADARPFGASADEEEPAGRTFVQSSSFDFGSESVKKKKAKKQKDITTLRSLFQKDAYLEAGAPNKDLVEQCKPKGNSAANQNFTPVFLAHARLYTFADMRLIHPLKSLTLHKLRATLLDFQLYEQRVGDIVELARYAYDNGPDRSEAGSVNELRQLVVDYMACEVDTVGKHKAFQTLLEEGGEFVTDFWGMITKYRLVA